MTRSADWDSILEQSSNMLEMARQGRWVDVAELHHERHVRLEKFFADYTVTDIASTIAEGIDTILRTDHELANLVKTDRLRLEDQLSQSKASAQAMSCYAETA